MKKLLRWQAGPKFNWDFVLTGPEPANPPRRTSSLRAAVRRKILEENYAEIDALLTEMELPYYEQLGVKNLPKVRQPRELSASSKS